MLAADKEKMKAWVEHWQRVGPILARIRREELRAFRYEDNIELVDSLLQLGYEFRTERPTSGLVEQQRWFMKFRKTLQQQKAEERPSNGNDRTD